MQNDPAGGTPDGDQLDILATLVQADEARHFPMEVADPIETIKFRTEQPGLEPEDLQPMTGKRNRFHEILNRRRALTLPMIWRLHQQLGIPAGSLLRQPALN